MTDTEYIPSPAIDRSSEQRAIQLARERALIVEANAGAAKTTTLALRIAQALARGAAPHQMLALTYTESAVRALRAAVLKVGVEAKIARALAVSTFDDFSARCLARVEPAGVLHCDTPELLKPHVLRAIAHARDAEGERHAQALMFEGGGEGSVEGLLRAFAVLKGTLTMRVQAHETRLTPQLANDLGHDYATLRLYRAFERVRAGSHPDRPAFRGRDDATFDLALRLLDEEFGAETAAEALEGGLGLIVLDEMHDTNEAMFSVLAALLANNPRAAFVGVGDRDQVIHSSAGADARFMGADFDARIAPCLRLPLTASYRFGPRQAEAAGLLARKPYAARAGLATELEVIACKGLPDFGARLVDSLRRPAATSASALGARAAKARAPQQAILVREAWESIEIENRLLGAGIDYRTAGFRSYLHRPEILLVRGLIAHARDEFAAFESEATRAGVLDAMLLFAGARIDSEEMRELSPQEAQRRAVAGAAAQPQVMCDFVEGHVLRHAAPPVRDAFRAAIAIVREGDSRAFGERFARALDPQRLARAVFVNRADVAEVAANVDRLIRFALDTNDLASFFRVTNEMDARLGRMDGKQGVILSSIEAAKGLEFEHVILADAGRGAFTSEAGDGESRNLLYVAITRASRRLTLLFDAARPGRHLIEMGLVEHGAASPR